MTQEEKARAYDEALEKAAALYKASEPMSGCNVIIETLFPELKESEDERIRKALIFDYRGDGCLCTKEYRIDFKDIRAWLEKQGEQKPADKVEPKFHEGELITNGDYTWKIIEVKPLDYILQSQDGNIVDDTISYVNEQFHSFTIKDAKDGDVLSTAWSEDDERIALSIKQVMNCASLLNIVPEKADKIRTWLKSLKDRVGCEVNCTTTNVWSKEDESYLNTTIVYLKDAKEFKKTAENCINWLKSLSPQYRWKPSDEQIHAFEQVYDLYNNNFAPSETLTSLYNDLKKLTE